MKALLDRLSAALEGNAPAPEDIPHFDIYQRFCARHRDTALRHVFAYCCEVLGDRWPATVEAYFRSHPMHHVEINENGDRFAEFLKDEGWLSELADFEWWEWRTRTTAGQLQGRLGDTVELRPYHYDFIDWDRSGPPTQRDTLVVFWRDRKNQPRRERVTAEELSVLRIAFAGGEAMTDDLVAAGILK